MSDLRMVSLHSAVFWLSYIRRDCIMKNEFFAANHADFREIDSKIRVN